MRPTEIIGCPLCGHGCEGRMGLSAHLFTEHEYEMEARRCNPHDPVYAALELQPARSPQEILNLARAGHGTIRVVKRNRRTADVRVTLTDWSPVTVRIAIEDLDRYL